MAAHDIPEVRKDYPGLEHVTYLDTSSCGLLARSTAEAARNEQERLMEEGSRRFMFWMEQGLTEVRRAVATNIGGTWEGTFLAQNFTVGLAQLAPMLAHRSKVLLVGGDYPTLHVPFMRNGFQVVQLAPDTDGSIPMVELERLMAREHPQVVAISHVQWATGHTIDVQALADLCRSHGAWSLVDATQSWCNVPIDLRTAGIDILGASGYKWPLAGFGNAFFHLSENVRAEIKDRHAFDPVTGLSAGHLDPVSFTRLGHVVDRIAQIGPAAIRFRVDQLLDHAVAAFDAGGVQILNGRNPEYRAGILMIDGGKERLAVMKQAGIRAALRGKGIRIGIHFYNNEDDIDRLVDALQ